jgi:DNA repair protein RAD50
MLYNVQYCTHEQALMRYHHMKIMEINKIIADLWQGTYKGGDIDGIEIVSGEEGASTRAARSYNYRVAMRKVC